MAAAKQAAIAGAEKYAINAREFVRMSTKMGEEAGERTGISHGRGTYYRAIFLTRSINKTFLVQTLLRTQ